LLLVVEYTTLGNGSGDNRRVDSDPQMHLRAKKVETIETQLSLGQGTTELLR